ncbi:DNA polymerase I [Gaopeijia maritima]|uniref:DNA polymerase I n=1 Tax=Gaopeijia maritima TaxID=3119007 RepID=A0ABU9E5E8_9BACT
MEIPPKTRPRLFLIDAYALIYRSYFAFIRRPLMNSRGENTSAPFGFTNFLEQLKTDFDPEYLAVVFDAGDSFREEIFPDYKATREKMPDDLRASIPRVRAIVEGFRDPVIELDGYEADDVIGTLARKADAAGLEAVIVSGDKDFYQLVDDHVHLLNPGRGGPNGVDADWVDLRNADEKFGIPPSQVIDYLALIGDSSDNVPGAPGIGPKTAVKLLQQFGDVESILAAAPELKAKRSRESLTENADSVRMSRELVTIKTDLPVDLDLDRLKVGEPDFAELRDLFLDLEFRRLAEKYTRGALEADAIESAAAREATYRTLTSVEQVAEWVEQARAEGRVAVGVEASLPDPMRGRLIGMALSAADGNAVYLPFDHHATAALELDLGDPTEPVPNLPPLSDPAMAPLRHLLADPEVALVGHDLKTTLLLLKRAGSPLGGGLRDAMVASYVLDPGRRSHDLDALAMEILAHRTTPRDEVVGKGRQRIGFAEVALDAARDHACERVDCAWRLWSRFEPELEEHALLPLFDDLEMPLVPVLARMEERGIRVDTEVLHEMSTKLRGELALIEEEIYKLAGMEFNLNSTPQLREVLFDRLELPVLKKTKTGPSTDASVLEELAADGHEVPRLMLEYRELEKLRNTYVDALPRLVHRTTGRIHTSFNQTVAATGRLSSSDPNLQNIPIRTALGREVRKAFVADQGFQLLGVDYSQIELRVLAHFSGDAPLVEAFRKGIDVHRQTAAVIFDVDIEEVGAAQRAQAKTINFATLYGQGAFSLARQLGISREMAQSFIDQYFERFRGVRAFLDAQVEQAKEKGYVTTLLGRRRYVPELKSRNWNVRQFGERVAQNTPIQGTAADMIKKAMLEVDEGLESGGFGARMLLQVHDELLFEVPVEEMDSVRELVVSRMEGAMALEVPLVAEWGVGDSWYDAKG